MEKREAQKMQWWARSAGLALLATIILGMLNAFFVADGIDINLSANVVATAENMMEAGDRLRAKAYISAALFAIGLLVPLGFFLLLRETGLLVAAWSLAISLSAALLSLLGAVFALNAAEIATDPAYQQLANPAQRLLMSGLQATADYTSFHLSLILSSTGMAGFFALFYRSRLMPKIIAGWGLFASLFVAITIVARDFIAILGHPSITAAFMLSNLVALLATGIYLSVKGAAQDN
ncbi:MAG: DUF4386 domain-containing protein [Parasphingorhabdus sp.]